MSLTQNGTYICDRCGTTLPDDSMAVAVRAVDSTETGQTVIYHFCQRPSEHFTAGQGCAGIVFSKENLAARIVYGLPIGVGSR